MLDAEVRRNATLVTVCAAVFALLQVVVVGFNRPLGAEELSYLPGLERLPLWFVRFVAMCASSAALLVAFRSWVVPAGRAAGAAAAAVAVSWAAVYYGSEVRPELLAAFAAVAAAGVATGWMVTGERSSLVGTTVALAACVLLDPTFGAVVVVVLAVIVAARASRVAAGLAAVALGAGAGLAAAVVWRLAAVTQQLRALRAGVGADAEAEGLLDVLALAADPAVQGASGAEVAHGAAMVVIGGALALLGVTQSRWPHRRSAGLVGVALGVPLLALVLLSGEVTAARLLAAYVATSLAVGAGALALWDFRRRTGAMVLTIAVVVGLTGVVVWQIGVAAVHDAASQARNSAVAAPVG